MSFNNFISKAVNKLSILNNRLLFKKKGISFGENLMVMGSAQILIRGKIVIGNNFNLISGRMYNPLGRNIKSCLRVDKGASLMIGNNVGMSCVTVWSKANITIGDNVKVGADVLIFDTDAHSLDYLLRRDVKTDTENAKSEAVFIGDDVFIGTRSIITKGVSIGNRSIVAAGSVVSKSIPEDEIWGGNPAKFIKKLQSK